VCEAGGTWATVEKGAGLAESDVASEAPHPPIAMAAARSTANPNPILMLGMIWLLINTK
jgi:hypothetical protein